MTPKPRLLVASIQPLDKEHQQLRDPKSKHEEAVEDTIEMGLEITIYQSVFNGQAGEEFHSWERRATGKPISGNSTDFSCH
jgi:uncharacterized protein YukE